MNKPYKRKLLEELRTWVDKRFVVVITGMRQVGKTTLFRMLFDEIKSPNKAFLDLENPIVQKAFQETNLFKTELLHHLWCLINRGTRILRRKSIQRVPCKLP